MRSYLFNNNITFKQFAYELYIYIYIYRGDISGGVKVTKLD